MDEQLPIRFQEHAQLQTLGIDSSSIGFNTVTMESDRFVCVLEKTSGQSQVVIVDLDDLDNVVKRPVSADSAIMHPRDKILALRSGRQIQIVNLDMKSRVEGCSMNEDIMFWKWISTDVIGIVTEKSVFHWKIGQKRSPEKVLEKHANMMGCQIINYRTDREMKWMLLIGISTRDGQVIGSMQLYSLERRTSQMIEGHAGAFTELCVDGQTVKLFTFSVRNAQGAKVHIVEIDAKEGTSRFKKVAADMFFPSEAGGDFPVAMQTSTKYGCIYLLTKYGFVHVYDLESGICIYMNRISTDTIFVSAEYTEDDGIIGVNRKGQVLSVSIDPDTIIPHIIETLKNNELAIRMAIRGDLGGAEQLIGAQFQNLVQGGQGIEAARLAASSPKGFLRTEQTISELKRISPSGGAMTPILSYFGVLLERGKLNRIETLELVRPVIAQGKQHLLEKWLREDKLECTEELGDLVCPLDSNMGLSIYVRGKCGNKVIETLVDMGQYSKIVRYVEQSGHAVDYEEIFERCVRKGMEKSVDFAKMLVSQNPPLMSLNRIVDIFLQHGGVKEMTSIILDVTKDSEEVGDLQTRCLEANIREAPQVADAILGNRLFSHYDRDRISKLCEEKGMNQWALENCVDFRDMKRILAVAGGGMDKKRMVMFFSRLNGSQCMECLEELMRGSENMDIVVDVCVQYNEILDNERLIRLYEEYRRDRELYRYLGRVISERNNSDPYVHFKYIEVGCRLGEKEEVERMCRESKYYDAVQTKNMLKKQNMDDPSALMIVCDRFGFVEELVRYLYNNGMMEGIGKYVRTINSRAVPDVVDVLLDMDCDEGLIGDLLIRMEDRDVDMDRLIETMERRNRMQLLLPMLETRLGKMSLNGESRGDGSGMYNAMGKIYVDSNNNPRKFLLENKQYDHHVLGEYCEKRNPELAVIAYGLGNCDDDLIRVTNENGFFREQAEYLVGRKSLELWNKVLDESNVYRKDVLEAMAKGALVNTRDAEALSIGVRSLMENNLNEELVMVLERIVFEGHEFSRNENIQNLMLIGAMKLEDPGRLYNYVWRLDNFNGEEMTRLAISNGNYLGAMYIYEKIGCHEEAMKLLLDEKIYDEKKSYEKALDYLDSHGKEAMYLYVMVGMYQIEKGRWVEGLTSIVNSYDVRDYQMVIEKIEKNVQFNDELHELYLRYLTMVRGVLGHRDSLVENEIMYNYCKLKQYEKVEEEMKMNRDSINWTSIGNRCFSDGDMVGSRMMYEFTGNHGKLAVLSLKCGDYAGAVEYGKKANNVRVWKQINKECLMNGEFRLAQVSGLNLLETTGDMEEMVRLYEDLGQFDEAIGVLEAGLGREKSCNGVYTELGVLYSKYREEKLLEHLRVYGERINRNRMMKTMEMYHQWKEYVFLSQQQKDYETSVRLMIQHSVDGWTHETMKQCLSMVNSADLVSKVLQFYVDEHPLLVDDLLLGLGKIDHGKVVEQFLYNGHLALIRGYLRTNQSNSRVSLAYIELMIEEENWKDVERSLEQGSMGTEMLDVADRLSKHEFVGFRRLAGHIYKRSRRWKKSYETYIRDGFYVDTIKMCVESRDESMVGTLLEQFVGDDDAENFFVILYGCHEFIRIENVVEMVWRKRIVSGGQGRITMEMMIPFMCQTLGDYRTRVNALESEARARKGRG